MAMTPTEANAYIEKAETLAPEKVDPAKLREAIANASTSSVKATGRALLEKVMAVARTTAKEVIAKAKKTPATVSDDELEAAIRDLNTAGGTKADFDLALEGVEIQRERQAEERKKFQTPEAEELEEKPKLGMDEDQARRYIQQAERLPADQVDPARLSEAIDVLDAGAFGSGDSTYVRRGKAIQEAMQPSIEQAEAAAFEESMVSPRVQDPRGVEPIDVRTPGEASRGARPSSDLLNRLDQAARVAGVTAAEVQRIVEAAQLAAAPLPPGVAEAYAAAGQQPPTPPSAEEILQAQILEWMEGTIGVPPDYIATREIEIEPESSGLEMFRRAQGTPNPTRTTEILPRYQTGDEWNYASMDPALIAPIQQQLVDAGLMEPGEFYPGVWTDQEAAAMQTAMGIANAAGTTIDETIQRLIDTLPQDVKDARAQADAAKVFQAPPFLMVDAATIAQDAKTYARNKIGRDPTAEEMAEISAQMSAIYRSDYEAEVSAMRMQFESQVATEETGDPVGAGHRSRHRSRGAVPTVFRSAVRPGDRPPRESR